MYMLKCTNVLLFVSAYRKKTE